jgi:hypothetical protein
MGENRGDREGEAVVGETPSPHPNPTLHHPIPQSPCSTGRRVMEGVPGEGEDRGGRKGQAVVGEEKPGREGKAATAQWQGKGREGVGEQWWLGFQGNGGDRVVLLCKKHPYFPFFRARSYIWNFVSFT